MIYIKKREGKIAQAQLSKSEMEFNIEVNGPHKNRKITLNIDKSQYVSVFKNEARETVIIISKGTRSVSISKDNLVEICDLKELVLLRAAAVEME